MALKTFVKVSGVNNLSDARYCAGMGVDMLGFNLNPAEEAHLTKEKFDEITEWISGVKIAGEFAMAEPDTIRQALDSYNTDYLEFSRPELARELSMLGKPMILRLNVSNTAEEEILSAMHFSVDYCDYFILESNEDILHKAQSDLIKNLGEEFPVIMAFGIHPDNINLLMEQLPIKGIALNGGNEIKPGLKDYEALADILDVLEIDDYA